MKTSYLALFALLAIHLSIVCAMAPQAPADANSQHIRVPGFSTNLRKWAQQSVSQTKDLALSSDDSSSPNTPTGAYVGIGFGALIVAGAVVAGIYYVRRRRASRAIAMTAPPGQMPIKNSSLQSVHVAPPLTPMPGVSPPSSLPPNWEEYYDAKYNQCYYFNRVTRETVWEIPAYAFSAAK
jgi:hypothetical protein